MDKQRVARELVKLAKDVLAAEPKARRYLLDAEKQLDDSDLAGAIASMKSALKSKPPVGAKRVISDHLKGMEEQLRDISDAAKSASVALAGLPEADEVKRLILSGDIAAARKIVAELAKSAEDDAEQERLWNIADDIERVGWDFDNLRGDSAGTMHMLALEMEDFDKDSIAPFTMYGKPAAHGTKIGLKDMKGKPMRLGQTVRVTEHRGRGNYDYFTGILIGVYTGPYRDTRLILDKNTQTYKQWAAGRLREWKPKKQNVGGWRGDRAVGEVRYESDGYPVRDKPEGAEILRDIERV